MPPSVVFCIIPELPTAIALFTSIKSTEDRLEIPEEYIVHETPPSVVFSITLELPTAIALFASIKSTEDRFPIFP